VALSKRRLSPYFLFALLILLAWASFRIVSVFLDYVLVALFLAYLTYPMYRRLLRLVRNGPVASFIMLVTMTAGVIVPIGFLSAQLVEEVRNVTVQLAGRDLGADLTQRIIQTFGLSATSEAGTAEFIDGAIRSITEALKRWVAQLPSALAEAFVGVFILLYVMYYSYTDGPRLLDYIRDALPMQEGHRELLFDEVGKVVRAVMYGSVLTALIQAILGGIGFAIFGIHNVVFWSVIMFILALLPIVGPPLVWGPWGIYLLLQGERFRGIGLLIYSAILVSTIDNVIRPKLIGAHAQVHPVIILLGVLGGIVVFGFVGFILGPLILSIFLTILNVYRKEFATKLEDDMVTRPT
jgi:predicted PurR-regulated permease PerM